MCTIVVFHRLHPDFDLLVAANRDEMYARGSTGPQVLVASPRAIGGVDLAKGGTWMGATEGGLFVGVTNQRTWREPDRRLRSRGAVVKDALTSGSVRGVDALLAGLDGREHNGFNLIYGDGEELHVAYAREDRAAIEIETLPPGLWVVPNDRVGSAEFAFKTERARTLAEPLVGAPWERLREELPRLLADHEKPALDQVAEPPPGARFDRAFLRELMAICIHTPLYGTCSATIAAVRDRRVVHYLFAPGAPCRSAAFAEHAGLFIG